MDTEKIGLLNLVLEYLAEFWSRFGAPVAIDRDIETNGRVVQIIVRYKPKKRESVISALTSDRAQDA